MRDCGLRIDFGQLSRAANCGLKAPALEPTIDTGLRAARDALASLASRGYFDQPQLGKTIDQLDAALAALDTTRGLAHQRVVADGVAAMSQAVRQMSGALSQRVTETTTPSTQPSND